jgi:hypothetical protein
MKVETQRKVSNFFVAGKASQQEIITHTTLPVPQSVALVDTGTLYTFE